MELEERRGFELRAGERMHLFVKPIARHPVYEEGVLRGPDGAAMITPRIVGGVLGRERPHSPPGKEIVCEESLRDAAGARIMSDPRGQRVATVRRDGSD